MQDSSEAFGMFVILDAHQSFERHPALFTKYNQIRFVFFPIKRLVFLRVVHDILAIGTQVQALILSPNVLSHMPLHLYLPCTIVTLVLKVHEKFSNES